MERNILDNGMLVLMLISIVAISILFIYVGVKGMAATVGHPDTPVKQAFTVAGYLLFFIIPLMILALVLDTVVISTIVEWGTTVLTIAVIVDLIILTVLYIAAFWIGIP